MLIISNNICIFAHLKQIMNSKIIEEYNLQKVKEIMLYILNKVGDIDYYKLMKMIFCADRNNLLVWAEPITNLKYTAKEHGPVPQVIYKEITRSKSHNDGIYGGIMSFVDEYNIHAEREADLNYLSKTDIESIDKAILSLKDKDWEKIEEELHDDVFKKLYPLRRKYSLCDIAESGGADKKIIERIQMNIQLNKMLA